MAQTYNNLVNGAKSIGEMFGYFSFVCITLKSICDVQEISGAISSYSFFSSLKKEYTKNFIYTVLLLGFLLGVFASFNGNNSSVISAVYSKPIENIES